jgi:hypothetical protein
VSTDPLDQSKELRNRLAGGQADARTNSKRAKTKDDDSHTFRFESAWLVRSTLQPPLCVKTILERTARVRSDGPSDMAEREGMPATPATDVVVRIHLLLGTADGPRVIDNQV